MKFQCIFPTIFWRGIVSNSKSIYSLRDLEFYKGNWSSCFTKERRFIKSGINPKKNTTSHISWNDLAWEGVSFEEFEVFGFLIFFLFSENAEQNFLQRWISESRIFSQRWISETEFFHKDGFPEKMQSGADSKDALDWGKCD